MKKIYKFYEFQFFIRDNFFKLYNSFFLLKIIEETNIIYIKYYNINSVNLRRKNFKDFSFLL